MSLLTWRKPDGRLKHEEEPRSWIPGCPVQCTWADCSKPSAAGLCCTPRALAAQLTSTALPKKHQIPFPVATRKKISLQLFEGLPASPSFYPFFMHTFSPPPYLWADLNHFATDFRTNSTCRSRLQKQCIPVPDTTVSLPKPPGFWCSPEI